MRLPSRSSGAQKQTACINNSRMIDPLGFGQSSTFPKLPWTCASIWGAATGQSLVFEHSIVYTWPVRSNSTRSCFGLSMTDKGRWLVRLAFAHGEPFRLSFAKTLGALRFPPVTQLRAGSTYILKSSFHSGVILLDHSERVGQRSGEIYPGRSGLSFSPSNCPLVV